jgi:hypothetical protein
MLKVYSVLPHKNTTTVIKAIVVRAVAGGASTVSLLLYHLIVACLGDFRSVEQQMPDNYAYFNLADRSTACGGGTK